MAGNAFLEFVISVREMHILRTDKVGFPIPLKNSLFSKFHKYRKEFFLIITCIYLAVQGFVLLPRHSVLAK